MENFAMDLPLEYYKDPETNNELKVVTSIDKHPAHLASLDVKTGKLEKGDDYTRAINAFESGGGHSKKAVDTMLDKTSDIVKKKPKKYAVKNNEPDFYLEANEYKDRAKIFAHPDDESGPLFTNDYLVDKDGNFSFSDLTERLRNL